MAELLPRLRLNLEFMPSPVEERPGLLIRDSYRYSDMTLIIPPLLVQCLTLFDGERTDLDLHEALVQLTGDIQAGEVARNLLNALSQAGFLENDVYRQLREGKHRTFAEATVREATLDGSAYPAGAAELRTWLGEFMGDGHVVAPRNDLIGIAAPHVSPEGGRHAYQHAYGSLSAEYGKRTFVILGTSHYGDPNRFGLTRKPFVTPLGTAATDTELVEALAREAGPAVSMEDYCHSVEHSIEFQVLFLQHLFGPDIRILPVLCGSYAESIYRGGLPEDNESVRRFIGALGEMAAREGNRLFWVLGIDLAHMGRRYGDKFDAHAGKKEMLLVEEQDRDRIGRIVEGDAQGFWERVQKYRDNLKWCGATALYTFLRTVPAARAELLHYDQWNIDPESVVTFGAFAFRRYSGTAASQ